MLTLYQMWIDIDFLYNFSTRKLKSEMPDARDNFLNYGLLRAKNTKKFKIS